jgi:hypothetical protein
MRVVSASETFAGSVHEAESVWYDCNRWPQWVDGVDRVLAAQGSWPEVGARITWESGPAGRGRVLERVISFEPLSGQTVEVEDDSIRGRQTVTFTPDGEGVTVGLSLAYEIKRRSILTPVIDVLFIRRAFVASIRTTLHRFGVELAAARKAAGS